MDAAYIHLNGLLNQGGSLADMEELMVTATAVVGFPTGLEGFRVFRRMEAERSEAAP